MLGAGVMAQCHHSALCDPGYTLNNKNIKSQEDCVQSLADVYTHEAQHISKPSLQSPLKGHFFVCSLSNKGEVNWDSTSSVISKPSESLQGSCTETPWNHQNHP